jgi:thioredoxin 1
MMTRKISTMVVALGLAVLLSAAITGCSNVKKSVPETTAMAISPSLSSSAPEADSVFRQKSPEPVRVKLPSADDEAATAQDQDAETDLAAEPTTGPALISVSDAATLPGSVVHVKEATFDEEVLQADVPVLVDFYAEWCGPCKKLAPVLDQLAYQTPDARIVKVNIDESPELAVRYGVKGIPHLTVFKDGKPVARHVGFADRQQLVALLSH